MRPSHPWSPLTIKPPACGTGGMCNKDRKGYLYLAQPAPGHHHAKGKEARQ
jgi:hypothetical protein